MTSKTAKMTAENEVSSSVEYKGNLNQVIAIMKAMRVKQSSIQINGYTVVRNGRNSFRVAEGSGYCDWLRSGTLNEIASRIVL